MKKLLSNDYLALLARLVLGLVFLVAGTEKIANPAAFAASIVNYKIVSHFVGLVLATILSWTELLCALAILFGISVRGSSLLLSGLLIVFTLAVGSALVRGLDISCGCFTQDPAASKLGWLKVGENMLLLLLSIFLCFSLSVRFSLEQYFRAQAK
jgi:uncharacterized membrane protein YphA (DoxX/SURF4 family)